MLIIIEWKRLVHENKEQPKVMTIVKHRKRFEVKKERRPTCHIK